MSLDLFMEDLPVFEWSATHIAALRKHWESLSKTTKMWEFNRTWYSNYFKSCSDKQILYYVITDLKYFSDWANEEAETRGLL